MSGIPVEVHWFPKFPDRFVTWNSEINLYQVKNSDEIDQRISTNISNSTTATLLAAESRYQYIRCVAPSYRNGGNEPLLAVGLANGKAALCNFVANTENNIEFTPKQSRPCVCLAWHEYETNLLAIGHDRNRSDYCITIWDTERSVPKESTILNLIGLSETAHSICWDKQLKCLIAGMSHKHIKFMDLRLPNAIVNTANTRSVYGLCVAPNGRFLASYIDNTISLWDIRNLEKPITNKIMTKNINNISWCSTRLNTLSILQRDSPFIQLLDFHTSSPSLNTTTLNNYNINHNNTNNNININNNNNLNGNDMENEGYSIKRTVSPFQMKTNVNQRNVTINYLSWHPNDIERLLVLSGSGTISDYKIQPRVAIAWDSCNNLWGSIDNNLRCLNDKMIKLKIQPNNPIEIGNGGIINPTLFDGQLNSQNQNDLQSSYDQDISEIMHKRALNDYGQISDMQQNGDLARNVTLKQVWKQLAYMTREDCLLGVKAILGIVTINAGDGLPRSDCMHIPWIDFPNGNLLKAYRSEQRDFAQNLCRWNFDRNNKDSFNNFIDDLCNKREYIRAAFICGIHLKIRQAIEVLGKGADRSNEPSNLRIAAIALSGLNFDKNTFWRTQCNNALTQIYDPYLRGLFAFLTVENDNYDDVLKDPLISVSDRMAFACLYLSDYHLSEYVKEMISQCTTSGDLNGLLLTGATMDGINLLQSYVDLTDDVQTTSLLSIKFLSKELIQDVRVQYWITSYRDLLDIWGLWEQRAKLDITMGQICSPPRHTRSVFLLCSFCGKSVSACLQEESRMRSTSSNINKLSSCPNCRKPLPRCSLCLLHMGTTTGISLQHNSEHTTTGWQSKPFSKWFSWCQTCRHGGHTEHLSQWFQKHTECPVASCTCKCFALDLQVR